MSTREAQAIGQLQRLVRQFAEDSQAAIEMLTIAMAERTADTFARRAMAEMDGRLPPAYPAPGSAMTQARSPFFERTGHRIAAKNDAREAAELATL